MTVKLLQVGMGEWGRDWLAGVIPQSPDVEVVAVVDESPLAIRAALDAGLLEGRKVYSSLDEALAHPGLDAVLGTVAIVAHARVVSAALAAGLPVLVEKPFATSLAQAQELVALGEEADLLLGVSQNYRYFPPAALAARLVAERVFGEPSSLLVDFRKLRLFDDTKSRAPEFDHAILTQISIHHFDLMRAILGEDAVRMDCQLWSPSWVTSSAPAATSATIQFDGGVVASYRATMAYTGALTPWTGEWRIECERGEIRWAGASDDGSDPGYVVLHPLEGEETVVPLPDVIPDRLGVVHDFARALIEGVPLPVTGRSNLGSIAMVEAARQSALLGTTIDIPTQ